jgi:hypothetical protein
VRRNDSRSAQRSFAKLHGHGPRVYASAARRLPRRLFARRICTLQPTCRRDAGVQPRRFSAGPKPGRDSFSEELGAGLRASCDHNKRDRFVEPQNPDGARRILLRLAEPVVQHSSR